MTAEADVGRFFDSRSAYMLFSTATNEKAVVAGRIGDYLDRVGPGPRALRIFDAGMGDGSVLSHLMRKMHKTFTHIPWLIVGKEISIEDVRLALDKLPDRFFEHPEMVFVVTNLYFSEAPALAPQNREGQEPMMWEELALEGATTDDFASQIREIFPTLSRGWAVRTSERTGNPLYERPSVLVIYRKDRRFLLDPIVPREGEVEGLYDLIIASQPYRARTDAERKTRLVLVPLAHAIAPGGRLVVIHSYGDDPGLEIIRNVWPNEDPFRTDRHELLAEANRHLADSGFVFEDLDDSEAIFQYQLHSMPSEAKEHIGTSLVMAAWNAAAYVAQIDEDRLTVAMDSGVYTGATRAVLRRHGGVWFNDELYTIGRRE